MLAETHAASVLDPSVLAYTLSSALDANAPDSIMLADIGAFALLASAWDPTVLAPPVHSAAFFAVSIVLAMVTIISPAAIFTTSPNGDDNLK